MGIPDEEGRSATRGHTFLHPAIDIMQDIEKQEAPDGEATELNSCDM